LLAGLLLASCLAPAVRSDDSAAASGQEEGWQVIFMQGQRVGYMYSRAWETQHDGQPRLWTEMITRMTIKRFGATLSMTITQVTQEDDEGNLLAFEDEDNNPPISNTRIAGPADGDTLHLETTAAGHATSGNQPWDADVKSPVYQ